MARKKQTTLNDYPRPRAECFILCDYARAENGKLYIVGGGWDQIVPQRLPLEYKAYLAFETERAAKAFAERVREALRRRKE